LEYKFWMTNGAPEDVWFYQFSADEFCKVLSNHNLLYKWNIHWYFQDILPTDLIFLIVEFVTLIGSLVVACKSSYSIIFIIYIITKMQNFSRFKKP